MALGLSKNYVQYLRLDNLTTEEFLVLAIEALRKLNWNASLISAKGFIASTASSEGSGEELKVIIDGKYAIVKSESTGNEVAGSPKNKENIDDFISTFIELREYLAPYELAQKYEKLKPTLVSDDQDVLSKPRSTFKEEIKAVIAIFKPDQGYFITPIIIILNVAIFIVMM